MKNKYYAEFYQRGVLTNKPVPASGSNSVYMLDGRHSSWMHRAVASDVARKRGYIGFRLHFGTFTRPLRSGDYVSVENMTDLQTVSELISCRCSKSR